MKSATGQIVVERLVLNHAMVCSAWRTVVKTRSWTTSNGPSTNAPAAAACPPPPNSSANSQQLTWHRLRKLNLKPPVGCSIRITANSVPCDSQGKVDGILCIGRDRPRFSVVLFQDVCMDKLSIEFGNDASQNDSCASECDPRYPARATRCRSWTDWPPHRLQPCPDAIGTSLRRWETEPARIRGDGGEQRHRNLGS